MKVIVIASFPDLVVRGWLPGLVRTGIDLLACDSCSMGLSFMMLYVIQANPNLLYINPTPGPNRESLEKAWHID
jgi:hypothetical protein